MVSTRSIALFVPCYKEAKRLQPKVWIDFIESVQDQMDLYFVVDGSPDETASVIEKEILSIVSTGNANILVYDKNVGKGEVLRRAMLEVSNDKLYDYYGFIDADLAIPLEQVNALIESMEDKNVKMAISSRYLGTIEHSFSIRYLASKMLRGLTNRYILRSKTQFTDVQCGCKVFDDDVLRNCFQEAFVSPWFFDLEILLRMRNNKYSLQKAVKEVPLQKMGSNDNSMITAYDKLSVFYYLWKINQRYN